MILSDSDILKLVKEGKLLDKFNPDQLTPNGYDLSIEKIEVKGIKLEQREDGIVSIKPLTFFHTLTVETITLPRDITADIFIKSKWARRGIVGSFGRIDAGFSGKLTLSFTNTSDDIVDFNFKEKGKEYCCITQVAFEKLTTPCDKDYSERSGNYQNSKDIKV